MAALVSLLRASGPRLSLPAPRLRRLQSMQCPPPYVINGQRFPRDTHSNTPPSILAKTSRGLHLLPAHPLSILRQIIERHFAGYTPLAPASPAVSVWQNFDELGFPPDHPGRSPSDSYYLNAHHMLRTHTSAHEVESYRRGLDTWLLSADVYRRDEIDASHYPVFHQMEGTHVWPRSELHTLPALNAQLEAALAACPILIEDTTRISPSNPYQPAHDPVHAAEITKHLKHSLNGLIFRLFGHVAAQRHEPLRVRWIEAYFPFTTPSYEVEVWWQGEWLELLGCGVVMQKTLDEAGVPDKAGWAFGLGLERLAMVLFSIPDIRLFWTTDQRFHSQFSHGQITTFKPYSRYPECYKDMSFWLPVGSLGSLGSLGAGAEGGDAAAGVSAAGGKGRVFHENDYFEIVREVAGDLVETVSLVRPFLFSLSSPILTPYSTPYSLPGRLTNSPTQKPTANPDATDSTTDTWTGRYQMRK